MLKPEEIARYGRQIILPGFEKAAQERLQQARILIIGAGGLGVPMLQYLAGMGAGTLGIVDDDDVEESNLHRQVLYRQADVGRMKVKAIKELLPKLNPHVKLEIHAERLTAKNAAALLGKYDVVADGSDNFQTKYLVNDTCVALGKPLVYGAVLGFDGQLSVFNLKDKRGKVGPNYRDLFPELPENIPDCAVGGVLGVVPGIIGSLMALEVVKVVTGVGEPLSGRVLQFDGLRHRFVNVQLQPLPATAEAPATQATATAAPTNGKATVAAPQPAPKAETAAPATTAEAPAVVEAVAPVAPEAPAVPETAPVADVSIQEDLEVFVAPEDVAPETVLPLKPELFVPVATETKPDADDLHEEEEPLPAQPLRRRSVQSLKPTELEEWGEREVPFSLIDVREPNEHQTVNIGGRLIPFTRIESNLSRFRPDVTYVIYCKNGTRSLIAAEMLLAHGVQNVYTLEGGILRYIREVAPELQAY